MMTEKKRESKEEIHTLPSPVQINYQERQMDFIQISPTEIDYLTDTSLPFQICLGLATTFLGAGIGITISFLATKNAEQSLKGYFTICYMVALGFGGVSWILFGNLAKMKKQIMKKKNDESE